MLYKALDNFKTGLLYLVLVIWAIFTIFPIYWVTITSFKQPVDVFSGPKYFPFIDFIPTLNAWVNIFTRDWPEVSVALSNSVIVSLTSASIALFIGALAAYGLVRFKYHWGKINNEDIAFWVVSQRMILPIVVVIPILIIFRQLHLVDTRVGLIVLYASFNLPFAVWLLKDFFEGVPRELEEAARVDGCNVIQSFFKVVIPVSLPGLVATFMFCLVFAWNEFLFALVLTFKNSQTMTVLIAGQNSNRGPEWWSISALVLLTILPVLFITLYLQKYLVKGLTMGAVKE